MTTKNDLKTLHQSFINYKRKLIICLICISSSLVYGQVNLNDSLIGYWSLDGNANDSSINNIDGTIFGAIPSIDRFGNESGAMSFDGMNDYISVDHEEKLNLDTIYSLSVWYHANNWDTNFAGQFIPLLCKGTQEAPSGTNYQLNLGIVSGISRISGGPNCDFAPTDSIFLNRWQNIIYIRNSDSLKAYIDGEIVYDSIACNGFINNNGALEFGRNVPGAVEYIDGSLDDIRIYNRALTEDEVEILSEQISTSTNFNEINNEIYTYPNPILNGRVEIKLNETLSNIPDDTIVELYSIQGQKISERQINRLNSKTWILTTRYKGAAFLTLSNNSVFYSKILLFL